MGYYQVVARPSFFQCFRVLGASSLAQHPDAIASEITGCFLALAFCGKAEFKGPMGNTRICIRAPTNAKVTVIFTIGNTLSPAR